MITVIKLILLSGLMGICLYTDLKEKKIYNKVTITGMGLGLLFNTIFSATPHVDSGFWLSLTGIVLGLLLFFIPFSLGGMGAGDLKLLGMVGAFLGWPAIGWVGLYSAIFGGVISLFIIMGDQAARKSTRTMLTNFAISFLHALKIESGSIPASGQRFAYSIAIALGVVLTLFLK